jgi:hypothetical protein
LAADGSGSMEGISETFQKAVSCIRKTLLDIGYQVVIGKMVTKKTMAILEKELKEHSLMN